VSTRWMLKKSARRGVAVASWASGWLAAREAIAPGPRLRAITYHRFGSAGRDPYCVAPAAFAAQMRWLADRGLAVSLDDVRDFVAGKKPLRPDSVLVTIDDGCRSTYTEALPILRDLGVPAVAFVSAGLVGAPPVASDHVEPFCTWDELGRLRDAGIEIGSHAFDHRSLGRMTDADARAQAESSRERIARELGAPARSFAYPFGTRADFGPRTDRILADSGYEIAFNSVHGAIRPGMDAISLPRVKVEGGEGLRMFELICRGGMDAWRLLDDVLWRVFQQRSETRAAAG
jgi:peptidoglycan/xylan/chitin deacetylase (PgdA/CDA1 family)